MTLVLETLGSHETLDAGCLGVWLLAFALGLDFTTDDELADLEQKEKNQHRLPQDQDPLPALADSRFDQQERPSLTSSSLFSPKNFLIFVARFGPNLFGNTLSVNPGSSSSPCFTTLNASTAKSIATIHPLTLFLFLSPVLRGL